MANGEAKQGGSFPIFIICLVSPLSLLSFFFFLFVDYFLDIVSLGGRPHWR